MRFTTLSFLIFFLIVYVLYWVFTGKPKLIFVLIASLLFYASWSIGFAIHFFFMVAFTYLMVVWIRKGSKLGFYLGVSVNLLNLALFKYFYLLIEVLGDLVGGDVFKSDRFNNWLFSNTGYDAIVLPLAISFYTFVLVAYVFDIKRGEIKENHSFLEFAVFAMYFPHLVAGPIIRHTDFFYQLGSIQIDESKIVRGMLLILTGLLKKVAVADNMAPLYAAAFANPGDYSGISNLLAGAAFSIWVYCDFSGYTDLARGMSLLMGIELPENFLAPFFSSSVRELWRTWHATLGKWMRDCVFIPLGGSRQGEIRSNINLAITFTLGGLWHGAHYPYIIWGFFHGVLLVTERALVLLAEKLKLTFNPGKFAPLVTSARVAFVFFLFILGAIFFNSKTVKSAFIMQGTIFTMSAGKTIEAWRALLYFLPVGFIFHAIQKWGILAPIAPGKPTEKLWPAMPRPLLYSLIFLGGFGVMVILSKFPPGGKDFLYFQF